MKHQHDQDFESLLRDKGLKSTPLRLALLEILDLAISPMTAEEITHRLKKVSFDRATLFRALKTFTESQILNTVDLGEGFYRYERNCELHHHHHHIICTSCKKIEVVPFCVPDEFKKFLTKKGYRQISHRMDFSAICKKCTPH